MMTKGKGTMNNVGNARRKACRDRVRIAGYATEAGFHRESGREGKSGSWDWECVTEVSRLLPSSNSRAARSIVVSVTVSGVPFPESCVVVRDISVRTR